MGLVWDLTANRLVWLRRKNGNTTQNILQVFFHVQAPRTRFLGVFSYAPKILFIYTAYSAFFSIKMA
jgi:hypothetical protein